MYISYFCGVEIAEIFSTILEYRQRDMCKYASSDILILSLFAALSGADDALEIVAYGFEQSKQTDYVGGQIEQRTCTLTHTLAVLDETHAYKNCQTVLKIESIREYNKGT